MSTTLTNGLKLPDKGSVDWYADMQNNYAILDGAVGTVAEHTSALAGKAPLVHTHTKSDITDLFNSANTWSGSQTFTANSIFSNFITAKESAAISAGGYGKGIAFRDYQDNRLGYIQPFLTSNNEKRLLIGADSGDIASNSNIIPNSNNSVNLGSSSYQWNKLYSKEYYYNGTAWGLDKANEWTGDNSFSRNITLLNTSWSGTTPPSTAQARQIEFKNADTRQGRYINRTSSSSTQTWIETIRRVDDNTSHNFTMIFSVNDNGEQKVWPYSGDIDLGNSNNRVKTLNGLNPGALSLPNIDSDGYIDLSGNISANAEYAYTPTDDGWLALYVQTTGFHTENAVAIFNGTLNSYQWAVSITAGINLARLGKYHGAVILPVKAGIPYLCWIKIDSSTTLSSKRLYFYKATGNV